MKHAGCLTCNADNLRRRDFLRVGSLSLLGINLAQFLRVNQAMSAAPEKSKSKAQACILLWLEGGPSQMDTWDPKANSPFRSISTNVAGIQVSELLPRVAKRMDKLSIIRTMYTEENNHPQASYYAMTGHRPNPAMEFPSFGSIITKEMGGRNDVPPTSLRRSGKPSAPMKSISRLRSSEPSTIRWLSLTRAARTSSCRISPCRNQ